MQSSSQLGALVALAGFALAFAFGFIANRAHFCTMGAIADIVAFGDWRRMRMWLLAIAVAIFGAHGLYLFDLVDFTHSIYTRPRLLWLSHLLGGLLFGIGMALASGCASKTMIRIGNGSLKALVVLAFLAISAYMTLRGAFALLRATLLDSLLIDLARYGAPGQDLASLGSATLSIAGGQLRSALVFTVGAALLVFTLKDQDFRASRDYVVGGVLIGVLVTLGWFITGHLGYGENPDTLEMGFFGTNTHGAESLTFVAPSAYLLELLVLWTDKSLALTFGIAAVLGTIAGSAAYALASGRFRWEGFTSTADLRNHILGAVLMGFGGVTALGCTIGQGISGLSTLALGSLITFGSILAGCALTIKFQYARMLRTA